MALRPAHCNPMKNLRKHSAWTAAAAGSILSVAALLGAMGSAQSAANEAGLSTVGAPAMPWVRLDYSPGRLIISGSVPSAVEEQDIVQAAQRRYAAVQVVNLLQVAAVANPNWLRGDCLPDLRGAIQASALLADASLVIAGSVRSVQALGAIAASTRPAADAGIRVYNHLQR